MHRDLPNQPERQPLDELNGALRRAVESVRSQPVPQEAMAAALERARHISPTMIRRPNWHRRGLIALTGMAASLLVGVLLIPEVSYQLIQRVAAPEVAAVFSPEQPNGRIRRGDGEPRELDKMSDAEMNDGMRREESKGAPLGDRPSDNAPMKGRPHPDESRDPSAPRPNSGGPGGGGQPGRLGEGGGRDDKENDLDKKDSLKDSPKTWKRDSKQPTFARVYVGDGNSLDLVSLQVTVTIDGPRARTVVDHIFHNKHARQLEGTFEYPMPTGASPSYFGMFLGQTRDTVPERFVRRGDVPPPPADKLAQMTPEQLVKHVNTEDWGTLQEARVVSKEKALEVYEEIVRGKIDPALLEYASGNTFRGRVFPIPAKGYNRVIIAYEELLPVSQDQVMYRYPLPDCKLAELQFTLQANAEQCKKPTFKPADARKEEGGSFLAYTKTWKDKGPGGDVLFTYQAPRPQIQAITSRQNDNGPTYLYSRVRPDLKVQAGKAFAQHAVFLLDTSLSEHPDRFNVNMKLLKRILETDNNIKLFNILTFNVGTAWVEPKGFLANNRENREKVLNRLDGCILEGATDLSAALNKLAKPGFEVAPGTPLEVFLLSDGQITWGEPDVAPLVSRFENRSPFPTRFNCYRTGLGADNLELFETLTRRGGGIFNCYTEGDLAAAAAAHRSQCLQIEKVRFVGGPTVSDVMVAGRKGAVYPGGELVVAARMDKPGRTTLMVEGSFCGEKFAEEYPIDANGSGELAARGWAEIAVASLLGLNDPKLDTLVTAYCQQFGIASRSASFLVLENAADYKRFNLEDERGKTVPGNDVGKFLDDAWKSMGKPLSARESYLRHLDRIDARVNLFKGAQGEHVKKLLAMLKDSDFELPEATIQGSIFNAGSVTPAYIKGRDADRRNVETYLAESKRRARLGDVDGAVRVLSSVIEEHAGRGDALRLVGYRLLDLKQPVHAVRLFDQVQRQRPFEPHSYLDLARSLEESGKFALAAVQYEIVLAGTWHNRFREELKTLATEEYARMMRQAVRQKGTSVAIGDHFGDRLEKMDPKQFQSDLRVSMIWNTDATDIDLWVIEPDGTKVFYSSPKSKNGGHLSQDMTQGYGPERFVAQKAMAGQYTIIVHYYSANPNLLAGETNVSVTVTRNAGTDRESAERHTVILKQANEQVEVCRVTIAAE
ncbi:MAG: hypothetical protein K2R98_20275 [Gemmataceae bacterium]|nr:hypothetical protein [Gemmataceae bacterium]